MSALAELAEAVVRIENKLDILFRALGLGEGIFPQLHFVGQVCPVCKRVVDYQVDVVNQIVKRKCGCATGKQPPLIPLTPVPQGAPDGRPDGEPDRSGAVESSSEDRPRR